MKNFKKLFASLAIVALLASSVPTAVLGASADYNEELTDAYAYASTIGATTQATIDAANMYGTLIRSHMAKMLSEYAKEVLDRTPDTTKTCLFTDISNESEEMKGYILEACQLGLMGVGITAFNPNGVVTRAEFGTVLSRALYGDANNGGEPYYKKHLEALEEAGIMKQISNPTMKEIRGYVMLMMMRADPSYVAPEEEVVLPGFVNVTRVGSVDTQSVPYNASLVKVGTVKLTAGPNGARVQSLAVARSGLGNASDIEGTNGIRAAINGVIASSDADFYNSLSQVWNVYFSPALDLKANESMEVELLVTLKTGAAQNSEHSFAVTAVNVSNGTTTGVPVTLGSLRTTSYKVSTANASLTNQTSELQPGKANQQVVDFRFAADTNALTLKSFAIARDTSWVDFTKRLANAKLYHNWEVVGNVKINADRIVVEWLSENIADGSSKTYELKADVLVNSDTANLKMKLNPSDVTAFEVDTNHNVRVDVAWTTNITFGNVFVTFTKKSTGNETVAPWTANIKLFNWEVKSSTNMFVRQLTILGDSGNGLLTWFTNNQLNIKVNGATVGSLTHPVSNPTQVNVSFPLDANVPVILTIEGTARDTVTWSPTYKYTVSLTEIRDASNNTVSVGTNALRAGDTTTIAAGTIAAKPATVAAPSSESVYSNASDLEIGRFALEAKAERMTVRKITATKAGSFTGELDNAISSVKLVNVATNQEVSASVTINTWDIVFDSMSIAVQKDEIVNLKLVVQTNNISNNNGQNIQFAVVINTANRQSGWSVAGIAPATTKSYKVWVRPPQVTGEKLADDRFLITVTNVDSENEITLQTGTIRILPAVDNNSAAFEQPFCVRAQWSTDDCSESTKKTWEGNKEFSLTSIITSALAKNNGVARFEVFVDSNVQVPTTLELQVRWLQYNTGSSESYMVSVK